MHAFDYSTSSDPIRGDLADAHRAAWSHIARAGAWLTGVERVAVAAETRRARDCSLCARRKAALSPYSENEQHAANGVLTAPLVDVVHRFTTDASRLTRNWYEGLAAQGVSDECYAEGLGVAVLAISIDGFHRAMGLPLEQLPEPAPGAPSRVRPAGLSRGEAWLPMIDPKQVGSAEQDLFGGGALGAAYVMRALTLVPNEVRAWGALSGAQYLSSGRITRLETGKTLDRSQMELVAGRVSALNTCFY